MTTPQPLTQCDQCGLQSEIATAFQKERRWLFGRRRSYCPTCFQKRKIASVKESLACLLVLGLLAAGLLLLDPNHWLGWWLLKLLLMLLLLLPMIIVHELAHALVGALMGLRVFAVYIGVGRTLFQRRLWGIDWVFKLLPFSGLTVLGSPPVRGYRLRLFLTTLAGPASHALVLVCLLLLKLGLLLAGMAALAAAGQTGDVAPLLLEDGLPLETTPGWLWLVYDLGGALLSGLAWANGVLLVISLFPTKSGSVYGTTNSDGMSLLKLPFTTPAELQEAQAAYYMQESVAACQRKDFAAARRWIEQGSARYPHHRSMRNTLGYVYIRLQDYARARQIFLSLAEPPDAQAAPAQAQAAPAQAQAAPAPAPDRPELKFIVLNNIASSDLLLDDPSLLPEADRCSAEAHKNFPWHPAILGTRGAVLVELGQLEAGIDLLQQALAKNEHLPGQAIEASYLAIAEARRGNRAAAKRHLALARRLDPDCPILPRAASNLARA